MRSESEIVADLMQYSPQDGNWLGLEDLLAELWATGPTSYCLPALFGIFERFPTDCAGPLWSTCTGWKGWNFPMTWRCASRLRGRNPRWDWSCCTGLRRPLVSTAPSFDYLGNRQKPSVIARIKPGLTAV